MASETDKVSWEDSRDRCEMNRTHLVFIDSKEEWHFLKDTILQEWKSEYFIGLKNQSGEWIWKSNYKKDNLSKGYFKWAPGQPSGSGKCGKMYLEDEQLLYDDVPCEGKTGKVGFICETDSECDNEKGMS